MNIEKEIHLIHFKFDLLEAKVNSFHYATQKSIEENDLCTQQTIISKFGCYFTKFNLKIPYYIDLYIVLY